MSQICHLGPSLNLMKSRKIDISTGPTKKTKQLALILDHNILG